MDNKKSSPYEWIALCCQANELSAFEDLVAVMERPLFYYAISLIGNQDSGLTCFKSCGSRCCATFASSRVPAHCALGSTPSPMALRWIESAAMHPGSGPSRWSLKIFKKPK